MRQNGRFSTTQAAAPWAAGVLCVLAAGAAAPQVQDNIAVDFCWHAEKTIAARSQCELDYLHGARRYLAYGKEKGFLDADGQPIYAEFVFNWRTMLGMPSGLPFNHCTTKYSFQAEGIDFRGIWACLVELDPDAAKMDQI